LGQERGFDACRQVKECSCPAQADGAEPDEGPGVAERLARFGPGDSHGPEAIAVCSCRRWRCADHQVVEQWRPADLRLAEKQVDRY